MLTSDTIEFHSPPALADGERWYAVHTLPLNEARARWHLGNQNFRTFMPKRRKTVRHARKLTNIEAPFFPRYLFVVLDISRHQWRCINGTYGVSSLVMCGDKPHPAPCGVVEALVASADAEGFLQLGRHLRFGGPVRLLAGPFAEHLAILDHLDEAGRIRVLLEIFGRKVAVTTEANNVLPLAQPD